MTKNWTACRTTRMLALTVSLGALVASIPGLALAADVLTGDAAVAAAGDFTLRVYINESDNRLAALDEIDAIFTEKHPNIEIERIEKSYEELITSARLVLSEPDAPCIVQGDQGRDTDGVLVKANLLLPLGAYEEAYGWTVDATARWSDGGAVWGKGEAYGVAPWYQAVGLYYNRDMLAELGLEVPKTFDELVAAFEAAKAAGHVPLGFGNSEKYPGSFIYEIVQNQIADKDAIRAFVFGQDGATFDTPENLEAAKVLKAWVDAGYPTPGYDGVGTDDAMAQFIDGNALFHLNGTWVSGQIAGAMGDHGGFLAVPPKDGRTHVSTGGVSKPLHIAANCPQPDAAAAYLDLILSDQAASIFAANDDLPAAEADLPDDASAVIRDIQAAKDLLISVDGTVPFEDVAVSGFGDKFFAAIQELMAGRITPEEFTAKVQTAYVD